MEDQQIGALYFKHIQSLLEGNKLLRRENTKINERFEQKLKELRFVLIKIKAVQTVFG